MEFCNKTNLLQPLKNCLAFTTYDSKQLLRFTSYGSNENIIAEPVPEVRNFDDISIFKEIHMTYILGKNRTVVEVRSLATTFFI